MQNESRNMHVFAMGVLKAVVNFEKDVQQAVMQLKNLLNAKAALRRIVQYPYGPNTPGASF